jgi:molybdenum cofactor cytidylyltransferase
MLDPAFTGRVNIRATGPGVVALDADAVARLNAVDPMITLATVPQLGSGSSRAPWSARSRSSPTPSAGAALEAACAAGRGR